MRVLPAIARELRAQSRQSFTYGLRVVGAAALLGVAIFFAANVNIASTQGGALFGFLNMTLFITIWVLAPLLAADCISRERREGTLGLLFLTPLKARDIVMAKGFVHGLRAMSLWLAVLPIMLVPLLQGGVGWREAALSVLINFSALCLALACGLLASAFSKTWLRAQVVAFFLAGTVASIYVLVAGALTVWYLRYNMVTSMPVAAFQYLSPWNGMGTLDASLWLGFVELTDLNGVWGEVLGWLGPAQGGAWVRIEIWVALCSLLGLFLAIELAARRVMAVWREEPPSARRMWIEAKLTTPVIGVNFLHQWMRRKLAKNPIGWLEQRSWSGRLVTWSWFAIMLSVYSALMGGTFPYHSIYTLQQAMAWLLLVALASSSAGSFQRERETGVMELLLVSPMSITQIVVGRLRGLWGQFVPAMALLLVVWLYFRSVIPRGNDPEWIQFFAGAFIVVPVVGLYHSLKRRTFLTALLATVFTALLLPFIAQGILQFAFQLAFKVDDFTMTGYWPNNGGRYPAELVFALWRLVSSVSLVTIFQLIIGVRMWRRLYRDMERRNFTFVRVMKQ